MSLTEDLKAIENLSSNSGDCSEAEIRELLDCLRAWRQSEIHNGAIILGLVDGNRDESDNTVERTLRSVRMIADRLLRKHRR